MPLLGFIKEQCWCGKPACFTPILSDDGHHRKWQRECHKCRKKRQDHEKYLLWLNQMADRPPSRRKDSVDDEFPFNRPSRTKENIERREEPAQEIMDVSVRRTNTTNRTNRSGSPPPRPRLVTETAPEAKPRLSREEVLQAKLRRALEKRRAIPIVEALILEDSPPNSSRPRPQLRRVTESVLEAQQRRARDQLEEDALAELRQVRAVREAERRRAAREVAEAERERQRQRAAREARQAEPQERVVWEPAENCEPPRWIKQTSTPWPKTQSVKVHKPRVSKFTEHLLERSQSVQYGTL